MSSKIFGYRRVSTEEQSLDRQVLGDVDELFDEKVSAVAKDRPELERMISMLRPGDHIKVYSVDRLARSVSDMIAIINIIYSKGSSIEFMQNALRFDANNIDPYQKAMLSIITTFAELELDIQRVRRTEGIKKAKELHPEKYLGSKPVVDRGAVEALWKAGRTRGTIAKVMKINPKTVQRILTEIGYEKGLRTCGSHRDKSSNV